MLATPEGLDFKHALIAPGQGNQIPGMGRELALVSPAAMQVWEKADRALASQLGFNLSSLAWNGTLEELTQTRNAQIVVSTDSLARAAALEETGKLEVPGWHAGNSLGLVPALVNSGALSFDGAVYLGLARGDAFKYAIDNSPKTVMVALANRALEHRDVLAEKFDLVDCLRNPGQTVMGGLVEDTDPQRARDVQHALKYLENELGPEDFKDFVFKLEVDAAFHSHYMELALPRYRDVVESLPITEPTRGRLVGASTVRELTSPQAIREELVSQLINVEDWAAVMDFLVKGQGVTRMTELNGATKLVGMLRRAYNGKITKITNDGGVVMAYEWNFPVMAGGSDAPDLDEIRNSYINWVAKRTGMEPEELTGESSFVDDASLDSEDIKALRAWSRASFGRNIPDEEAAKLLTIGEAASAMHKLLNG